MGQKTKPNRFRLGRQCRTDTRLFDTATLSRLGDKAEHIDRIGQNFYQTDNAQSNRNGGKFLNSLCLRVSIIEERRAVQERTLARREVVLVGGVSRHIGVEVYNPRQEEESKKEERTEEEYLVDRLSREQQVEKEMKLICNRKLVNLTSMVKEGIYKSIFDDVMKERKIKKENRDSRVSLSGVVGAILLNCIGPRPQLLANIIAYIREDSIKHSEVLSKRGKIIEVIEESKRGLVDVNDINEIREDRKGGFRGYRFTVNGTIDGARRTRKEIIRNGTIPLSSIQEPISYGSTVAKTKDGTLGVHVHFHY